MRLEETQHMVTYLVEERGLETSIVGFGPAAKSLPEPGTVCYLVSFRNEADAHEWKRLRNRQLHANWTPNQTSAEQSDNRLVYQECAEKMALLIATRSSVETPPDANGLTWRDREFLRFNR